MNLELGLKIVAKMEELGFTTDIANKPKSYVKYDTLAHGKTFCYNNSAEYSTGARYFGDITELNGLVITLGQVFTHNAVEENVNFDLVIHLYQNSCGRMPEGVEKKDLQVRIKHTDSDKVVAKKIQKITDTFMAILNK